MYLSFIFRHLLLRMSGCIIVGVSIPAFCFHHPHFSGPLSMYSWLSSPHAQYFMHARGNDGTASEHRQPTFRRLRAYYGRPSSRPSAADGGRQVAGQD